MHVASPGITYSPMHPKLWNRCNYERGEVRIATAPASVPVRKVRPRPWPEEHRSGWMPQRSALLLHHTLAIHPGLTEFVNVSASPCCSEEGRLQRGSWSLGALWWPGLVQFGRFPPGTLIIASRPRGADTMCLLSNGQTPLPVLQPGRRPWLSGGRPVARRDMTVPVRFLRSEHYGSPAEFRPPRRSDPACSMVSRVVRCNTAAF